MGKKTKIAIAVIVTFLVIIIGSLVGFYFYVNNQIYVTEPGKTKIFENNKDQEKANYIEEKGIFNILLIGLDARKKGEDCRTDSMILATIDTSNKKLKLTSFMRDMFVHIPGYKDNRINTAFFLGGPELLIKTLNEDFNLSTQYYFSIDFKAFQALVDKLGGVDVEVKEKELQQLNYYIKNANWSNPIYVKKAGYQHLVGQQALSYCRIRHVGNNDYERTERQRRILSLLADKAMNAGITKIPDLISTILPYVKTNISTLKLMNLAYTVLNFGKTPVQTVRIPADGMFSSTKIRGMDILLPDMEKNAAYLQRFIFSTGTTSSSSIPVYLSNDFHSKDVAIDKRGDVIRTVKADISKADTRSDNEIKKESIKSSSNSKKKKSKANTNSNKETTKKTQENNSIKETPKNTEVGTDATNPGDEINTEPSNDSPNVDTSTPDTPSTPVDTAPVEN